MADNGSTERDVKDFKFQQLCKIRVGPKSGENVQSKRSQLLTSSNKYGLIIVGCEQERSTLVSDTFPPFCQVGLPQQPLYLALSCDDLTLAVCIKLQDVPHLLFYDVRCFADKTEPPQPFLKTPVNGSNATELLDIAWNPTSPNLCAVCTTDGYLELFEITDKHKTIASLPPNTGATCLCWSPKGKQLVVGKKDGTSTQYDQALTAKKNWPLPNILDGDAYQVLDIVWISTYMFAAAYIPCNAEEADQPMLVMTVSSKEGKTNYINFDDVCFGNGEESKRKYFLNLILQWEMVVCSSNNALETVVIGKNLDNKVSWERWNLDDSVRAEMPLTDDHNDTFPIGVAINTSSQQPIPLGDNKELPPCPLLFCYSTDGLLIPYYMVYTHKDAISINSPAQHLTSEGARIDKGAIAAFQSVATQPTAVSTGVLGPNIPAKPLSDANAPKLSFGGAPAFSTTLPKEAGKGTFGAPPAIPNTGLTGFSFPNKQTTVLGSSQPSSETVKTTATGGNLFGSTAKPGLMFGQLTTTSAPASSSISTAASSGFPFSSNAAPSFGQTISSIGTGTSQPSFPFGAKTSQPQVTEITSVKQPPQPTTKTTTFGSLNLSSTSQAGNILGGTTQAASPFTNISSKSLSAFSVPSQPASTQPSLSSATTTKRPPDSTVLKASQPSIQPAMQPHPSVMVSKVPSQPGSRSSPAPVQQKPSVPAPSTPVKQTAPVQPSITHAQTPASQRITNGKEDTTFNRTIIEEMKHFEKELQDLRMRSKNLSSQIGTNNEMVSLKKHTDNIDVFNKDIKETTKAQNKEIEDERARCLDAYATLEESRVRQERHNDPHYHHLLKTKSLDPASGLKMRQLQQEYQILERATQEADSILETQWEEYQAKKKNKSRLPTPTRDNLYRILKANQYAISNFRNNMVNIESQLKELRLYNRTSPWKNQASGSRTTDGKTELTSLANSLLENVHLTSANKFSKYPSITPEKQARLRRHLSQRVVPQIKSTIPANLSVSRLASSETISSRIETETAERTKPQAKPDERIHIKNELLEKDTKPFQTQIDSKASIATDIQPKTVTEQKPSMELKLNEGLKSSTAQKPESITPELQKQPVFNFSNKQDKSAFSTSTPDWSTSKTKPATVGQQPFQMAPNTGASVSMFGCPAVTARSNTQPTLFTKTPADPAGPKSSIYPTLDDITPPSSVTADENDTGNNEDEEYTEDAEYDNEEDDEYDEEEDEESEDVESDDIGFGHEYNINKKEMGEDETQVTDKTLKDLKQSDTPDVTPTKSSTVSSTTKPNISGVPKNLFGTPPSKEFAFGSPGTKLQNFTFGDSKSKSSSITTSVSTTASFPASTVQSTEDKKSDKKALFDTSSFNSFTKGTGENKTIFGTKPTEKTAENISPAVSSTGGSLFGNSNTGNSTSPGKFTFSVTPKASSSNDKPLFGMSSFMPPSTANNSGFPQGITTSQSTVSTEPAEIKSVHPSVPLDREAQNSLLRGLLADDDGKDSTSGQTTSTFQLGQALTSACISPGSTSASTPLSGVITASTGPQSGGMIGNSTGSVFTKPPSTPPNNEQTEKSSEIAPKGAEISSVNDSKTATSVPVIEALNSQTVATTSANTGLFGSANSTTTSGVFGSSTATTGKSLFGGTSQTKEQSGSLFGPGTTGTVASAPSAFPTSMSATTTSSGGIFSAQATASTPNSFGISSTNSLNNVPNTTSQTSVVKSLFGQPSNQTLQTTASSLFGVSSIQSSGFGQTTTASTFGSGGSLFGQPSTTTQSSVFGQTAFGTAPSTTSTSVLGSSTFGQPSQTSSFGKPPAFGQPASFGSAYFGQNTTTSESPSPFGGGSGGLLSGLGGKPSEEKANTNVFGSPQQFGGQPQQSASLFGNKTASKFGENVNKPQSIFDGGSGTFSGNAGSVSSTGFGTPGQQPQAQSTGAFGASPSFGGGQTGFGAAGASAFGAKPSFGTSPTFGGGSAFGSAPAFSSPVGGSTFGNSSQQQSSSGGGFAGFAGGSSPTFGSLAQTTDKPPSFGGFASGGTPSGFGGSAFGGSTNTPTGFGSSQAQPSAFGSSPSFTGHRG